MVRSLDPRASWDQQQAARNQWNMRSQWVLAISSVWMIYHSSEICSLNHWESAWNMRSHLYRGMNQFPFSLFELAWIILYDYDKQESWMILFSLFELAKSQALWCLARSPAALLFAASQRGKNDPAISCLCDECKCLEFNKSCGFKT